MASNETTVYPVIEEHAQIEKRVISDGKVRIRTLTDVTSEIAAATLEEQKVDITTVPVNRPVDSAPPIRTEDDVIIIPVMEEILVIHKQLVLKEELHIRRRITQETVERKVPIRKQRVEIDRLEASETSTMKGDQDD